MTCGQLNVYKSSEPPVTMQHAGTIGNIGASKTEKHGLITQNHGIMSELWTIQGIYSCVSFLGH